MARASFPVNEARAVRATAATGIGTPEPIKRHSPSDPMNDKLNMLQPNDEAWLDPLAREFRTVFQQRLGHVNAREEFTDAHREDIERCPPFRSTKAERASECCPCVARRRPHGGS